MNMRVTGSYPAGLTSPVDKRIGDAFPIVEGVYKHLKELTYLAHHADKLILRQIQLRANLENKSIEWRYEGEGWLLLCTFNELTQVDLHTLEDVIIGYHNDVERMLGETTEQATQAAASASSVFNSTNTASTKAGEASSSATSALASSNNADTKYKMFDKRYLGSKTDDPTTDNYGQPLLVGAEYWNSVDRVRKVWAGTEWLAISAADLAASGVTKLVLGLGNVDNTSDADKPISTAQQTALDSKVDKVAGKGLSSNDFTDAERVKLAIIAKQGASNWTIDAQPYPINAQVYHNGKQWLALRANSVAPTEGEDWSAIGTASQLATKANTSTQVIAAGTCTTNGTTNNTVQLTNIVTTLGLEVGDVIRIQYSGYNKLHTVESITDANSIIVNYEHAGNRSNGSLKLANLTTTVTITRIAKWYNAPIGLGQEWVNVTGSRVSDSIYSSIINRTLQVSVYSSHKYNNFMSLYVDGVGVGESSNGSTEYVGFNLSAPVPPSSTYKYVGSITNWAELR